MKLYDYFRSSAAFRVRIALNLKGLAHEDHFIHLRKGEQRDAEYLKVNPQGLVPALVDDGHVLTQSLAIIEYLDETRPDPALLPRDALGRARVRALAQIVACEIHPLNNLRVLNYLAKDLGLSEEKRNGWYRHWVAEGLAGFERMLAQTRGTGAYCHGEQPTLADICLIPQIFNAKRFDCDLSPYGEVMRIFAACMRLPAFDAAQPAKRPDAE